MKIPRWIRQATGKLIQFDFANGMKFPNNVKDYCLIVHCGGCMMMNRRQMLWRVEQAEEATIKKDDFLGNVIKLKHRVKNQEKEQVIE